MVNRFSRYYWRVDGNGGGNDQGNDGDDDQDLQDPLDSDDENSCIPIHSFPGFASPRPQNNNVAGPSTPVAGPSTAPSTQAQGESSNQSPSRPSVQPAFEAEDAPWRERVAEAILEVLERFREADIITMMQELRGDIHMTSALKRGGGLP